MIVKIQFGISVRRLFQNIKTLRKIGSHIQIERCRRKITTRFMRHFTNHRIGTDFQFHGIRQFFPFTNGMAAIALRIFTVLSSVDVPGICQFIVRKSRNLGRQLQRLCVCNHRSVLQSLHIDFTHPTRIRCQRRVVLKTTVQTYQGRQAKK